MNFLQKDIIPDSVDMYQQKELDAKMEAGTFRLDINVDDSVIFVETGTFQQMRRLLDNIRFDGYFNVKMADKRKTYELALAGTWYPPFRIKGVKWSRLLDDTKPPKEMNAEQAFGTDSTATDKE